MSPFVYRDGTLHCESLSVASLADQVGTPLYVYSAGSMRGRLAALQQAFAGDRVLFCYAIKANANLAVVSLFGKLGAGADTVSGGEVRRALAAGVPPSRIVFAGVAKTDDEIRLALETGILQFNVESVPELLRIGELAAALGRTAQVAFRINPDVAAGTHDKISTGRKHDKFGIPIAAAAEAYALARSLPAIDPAGIHLHIGSQITRLEPFEQAFGRGIELYRELRAAGVPLRRLDFGGGLGVRYRDETPITPQDFAAMVRRLTSGLDCELIFEPGRYLVGEAGGMVSTVIYVKETEGRRFAVLDAGMHVLIRPMLYDAHHEVLPVTEPRVGAEMLAYDLVGPICESTDVFARGRKMPHLERGQRVLFLSAGAYGRVMSSDYNSRPSAAEVLVDGDRWTVVKPHREAEAQFADERIPDWFEQTPTI